MEKKMVNCEAKVKKWGNSLGLVLPREIVEEMKLKENQSLDIFLVNKGSISLSKIYGKCLFKKSAQQIKDEIRGELYDD